MPRYYFNFTHEQPAVDVEGAELSSLHDARLLAIEFVGETMRDLPSNLDQGHPLRMEITDETHSVVSALDVIMS